MSGDEAAPSARRLSLAAALHLPGTGVERMQPTAAATLAAAAAAADGGGTAAPTTAAAAASRIADNLNLLLIEEDQRPSVYGVLMIRVKQAKNLISPKLQPGMESMYCKISIRNQTKRTNVVRLRLRSCDFFQTKHLPTPVVRSRKHPFNLLRIQLLAFDSMTPTQQELIGTVAFHLHDVIKVGKVSNTFDIFDGQLFVGELDLDIAFCYGLYGYGYSFQLKDDSTARSLEEHLAFSLLPRIPPPPDRTEWDRVTLAPAAVPRPPFCELKDVVPLSYAKEIQPLLETLDEELPKTAEFMQTYMQRYTELRERLVGIRDRQKRLHFLHHVISAANRRQEAIKTMPPERRAFIRTLQPVPQAAVSPRGVGIRQAAQIDFSALMGATRPPSTAPPSPIGATGRSFDTGFGVLGTPPSPSRGAR